MNPLVVVVIDISPKFLLQLPWDVVVLNSDGWPTLSNLRDYLYSYRARRREALWLDSAIRAVAVLCFGELGKVVNIQSHQFLPWILDKNVVLELDALSEVEKTFFIELLLLWIHHHRLQEPDREKLKHVILIEEAHHILLRKKQEIEGTETVVDTLIREIRELGEGIVVIDQHPSLVSRPALGNTYTTICLNLKEATDVRAASDAMLLKDDQREYLGHLPVGQGIVKLQDRWTRPFLVDFPR